MSQFGGPPRCKWQPPVPPPTPPPISAGVEEAENHGCRAKRDALTRPMRDGDRAPPLPPGSGTAESLGHSAAPTLAGQPCGGSAGPQITLLSPRTP